MANVAPINSSPKRKALAHVRKGVFDTPIRVLIYGGEKVGKSTFAAGAPSPIFIGAENGTERLDVSRLQPSTWVEALDWVNEIANEPHEYKTIVVDPVNWLEPLCLDYLTASTGTTIETFGGGYNKIYDAEKACFRELIFALERCWKRGMHVVITSHAHVKGFQNPEGASYDRYELAMHPKSAGALKQWVDAILFARLETFTKKEEGSKRSKGFATGARMLHTQPSAAYDAGARWGLPDEIDLSWDTFYSAVQAESGRAEELATRIRALLEELKDASVTAFSVEFLIKNKGNANRLAELVNRLSLKIEQKKEGAT